MRLLANEETRKFFQALVAVLVGFSVFSTFTVWCVCGKIPVLFWLTSVLLSLVVLGLCFMYITQQHRTMENAVAQIQSFLDGNMDARIACDKEGDLYHLFHQVNTLATVLNAHAAQEETEKVFLKNTISDISHQLKTPLTALNIYNELLKNEVEDLPEAVEFADLSERELDRMETLVQNLLKLTQLDAGMIEIAPVVENVADMMKDVALHFAYRARQEQKQLILSGDDSAVLSCDRDWLTEALSNIVKNAFDHTKAEDTIQIEWKSFGHMVQIKIRDTGCGIHPEDMYHIFKRFYRSRFSQDTQGLGLGLPLAKAIIEAHGGAVEVESMLGLGTTFTINFLIPTKL